MSGRKPRTKKKQSSAGALSKEEEEAKSAALIAKLLAQDQAALDSYSAYYDEYANTNHEAEVDEEGDWEEEEEDDYDPLDSRDKSKSGQCRQPERD
jgi:hypothetical protein